MPAYIITFELNNTEKLDSLLKGLKSYGSYCPINDTSWAIRSEKTAVQIRDHLLTLIGSGDRVFVIRSGTEAAWSNSYGPKHDEWLKKHL